MFNVGFSPPAAAAATAATAAGEAFARLMVLAPVEEPLEGFEACLEAEVEGKAGLVAAAYAYDVMITVSLDLIQ